jgi:hypothetical protein
MKFEYEMKDVRIVRHLTLAEALTPVFGISRIDIVSGLLSGNFHAENRSQTDVFSERLAKEYEGDRVYRRTCVLVSLDRDWNSAEFFRELVKNSYYPASVSEGVSYLTELLRQGKKVESVFHLGTRILSEDFREQRLLMKGSGKYELVPFYSSTKIKARYHVVAIKEEKVQRKR